MDQQLKERLVGAAVLVVLAAIFVPMVLDGPEQPTAEVPPTLAPVPVDASTFAFDLNAPLPGAPASGAAAAPTTLAAVEPAAPATTSKPAVAPPVATSTEPKPAAKAPAPTTKPTESASKSSGWAAQVGSFSKEATAASVATDLKRRGFKAFVMVHRADGKTLYRVRVGPVATREAADALGRKITQQTGQAARPVPHP